MLRTLKRLVVLHSIRRADLRASEDLAAHYRGLATEAGKKPSLFVFDRLLDACIDYTTLAPERTKKERAKASLDIALLAVVLASLDSGEEGGDGGRS